MKDNRQRTILRVEELESRSLPSATMFSPAVQADLMKLRMDGQKFQSDIVPWGPTLQKDQQAIQAAIAASPAVQAARTMLTNDIITFGTTLQADGRAIFAATDPATRMADIAKFFADLASAS